MRAIFFDVDDTLYDQTEPFTTSFQKYFGQYKLDNFAVYKALRKHSDALFDDCVQGKLELSEMRRLRIQMALEDFGITVSDEVAELFQQGYLEAQQQITLVPEMAQLLTKLQQEDVQIGILTNGPGEHQQKKVNQLQLTKWIPAENIFISGIEGLAKPDPAIFKRIEERTGVSADQAIYIGDSYQNDIVGADAAGWQSIWLNHREHDFSKHPVQPTAIITHHADLLTDPALYTLLLKG
ncbi:HAD family hydrolase [Isobaculum melis]|uniref:Putative hydrolase of the HAD superfamily n=1 Tax=Isobaculum melis TaxID=142588 RepID=A0A1H9UFH9_9LACT|nr:HAD family hydrolase [Isobaculum melis]SES07914.1 putative hydrolase of the HAD superfamily [Isobaculum melis]